MSKWYITKTNSIGLLLVFITGMIIGVVLGYTWHYKATQGSYEELEEDNRETIIQLVSLSYELTELSEGYRKLGLVVQCESKGKHDGVWGDLDYPYPAYGIAQFQERTFTFLKKLAGRLELKHKEKADQVWLLDWSIKNGFGHFWTCYRTEVAIYEGQ